MPGFVDLYIQFYDEEPLSLIHTYGPDYRRGSEEILLDVRICNIEMRVKKRKTPKA